LIVLDARAALDDLAVLDIARYEPLAMTCR
jgi:hypothetical protein